MLFFSLISAVLTAVAVSLGVGVIRGFLETGLVPRFPTAILAASIQIVAFICLTAGLVLDSVCRSRREAKRLAYLALAPVDNPQCRGKSPKPPNLALRLRSSLRSCSASKGDAHAWGRRSWASS
jgi:hypothetical protein